VVSALRTHPSSPMVGKPVVEFAMDFVRGVADASRLRSLRRPKPPQAATDTVAPRLGEGRRRPQAKTAAAGPLGSRLRIAPLRGRPNKLWDGIWLPVGRSIWPTPFPS
jgi:hypothetical protein